MRPMFELHRLLLIVLIVLIPAAMASAADMLVIFGTMQHTPGKGFSVSHFDPATGALSAPKLSLETPAPAYFVISSDHRHIYSCNGLRPSGTISAYTIDPATGTISLLNSQPAGGGEPCYVTLDTGGRFALLANYDGGYVAVYPILPDGRLGERIAIDHHTGHSVNPQRQSKPYAHSIRLDPANHFALACDLGVDKVYIYRFDAATGSLTPNDPAFATLAPGTGPRHLAFSKDARFVYVVGEMLSTITQFAWDAGKGTLTEVQVVSTLPPDFHGTNTAAEILTSADGRFLYTTNRGHNSLAVFAIDSTTGKLTPLQDISTSGKTPRNFAFDPSGNWLIVTNQESGTAVVFKVDPNTGQLTQVGKPVEVPNPFCPRFLVAE